MHRPFAFLQSTCQGIFQDSLTAMAMTDSQEHFHGFELNKETPSYTWTFNDEEDDEDFMMHTLFLKNAVLGASAVKGERNLIQIETKNFEKNDIKQPLLSLTLGQSDMCNVDVSFGTEIPVTFRLVEGTGPIYFGGQHLVEFPPEDELSQDESGLADESEDDVEDEEDAEEESPKKPVPSKKRKAPVQGKDKAKKGKLDESSAGDSVDDEDEEDEDEDEEDMEDDESSPDAKTKKKGGKAPAKKGLKTTKISPKKAAAKKGGKKKDKK